MRGWLGYAIVSTKTTACNAPVCVLFVRLRMRLRPLHRAGAHGRARACVRASRLEVLRCAAGGEFAVNLAGGELGTVHRAAPVLAD